MLRGNTFMWKMFIKINTVTDLNKQNVYTYLRNEKSLCFAATAKTIDNLWMAFI